MGHVLCDGNLGWPVTRSAPGTRDSRYSRIGRVLKREKVLGCCALNPAEDMVALLAKPRRRNHAALTYSEWAEFSRRFAAQPLDEAHVSVPGVPVPVKMWDTRWIDRQLDHVDCSASGRYNRAEYLEPRRALMQWWGGEQLGQARSQRLAAAHTTKVVGTMRAFWDDSAPPVYFQPGNVCALMRDRMVEDSLGLCKLLN